MTDGEWSFQTPPQTFSKCLKCHIWLLYTLIDSFIYFLWTNVGNIFHFIYIFNAQKDNNFTFQLHWSWIVSINVMQLQNFKVSLVNVKFLLVGKLYAFSVLDLVVRVTRPAGDLHKYRLWEGHPLVGCCLISPCFFCFFCFILFNLWM